MVFDIQKIPREFSSGDLNHCLVNRSFGYMFIYLKSKEQMFLCSMK